MIKKKNLFDELKAEIFGTAILILGGNGVVANVLLAPRLAAGAYDWNTIAFGWGFAVTVAVLVSGGVSGAHLNPAVTISLSIFRGFPAKKVCPYIIAQIIGGFIGAALTFIAYYEGMVAAGLPNIYTTGPGSAFETIYLGGITAKEGGVAYSLANCFGVEVIGTAILLIVVMALGDKKNWDSPGWFGPLGVGIVVTFVGFSLSGPSGYAINPARDLGPRLFGLLSGTQGLFDGAFWWVSPIIGPIVGGVVGILIYDFFITMYHKKEA